MLFQINIQQTVRMGYLRRCLYSKFVKKHQYQITYPALDENGEIEFNGQYFTMKTIQLKPNDDMETEDYT